MLVKISLNNGNATPHAQAKDIESINSVNKLSYRHVPWRRCEVVRHTIGS